MRMFLRLTPAMLLLLAFAGCAHHQYADSAREIETALDKYAAAPAEHYRYEVVNTVDAEGYTTHFVKMVSQRYLTEEEVNRPEWEHDLIVIEPDHVASSTGFLYITGGSNNDEMPGQAPLEFVRLAMTTNTVVSVLKQVPNQPLMFADEPGNEMYEDETIAYTWDKYLRTGDEKWPLRLPMTKSAAKAMDTVQDMFGNGAGVEEFVVAGGSKRGWTTWTTAATDDRVKAIIPIVIDLLNIQESFRHHWSVYGFWAPAVGDYEERGIMNWFGTPEQQALYDMVDPYSYRERYTMPKFILNATGDQFFLPDSWQFYHDDLPGETYFRYVPNADHGMDDTDAFESLMAYYYAIVNDIPRPDFEWEVREDDSIVVETHDQPDRVLLWQAVNPDARDFRVDTIGRAYESTELEPQSGGVYVARVEEPRQGWKAFYVELHYDFGAPVPFKFSTGVHVVPRETPYEYTPPKNPPKGFITSDS